MNIDIHGSKNSALPIIASTILEKKIYYIKNIPQISDIDVQFSILKQFNVIINRINKFDAIIDTTNLTLPNQLNYDKNARGTYYFIGSSFHYNTKLEYLISNGCNIDTRNIDYHIQLLKLTGKDVYVNDNSVAISGNYNDVPLCFELPKPSVGGTLNALMIFSKFRSTMQIKNYAKDPYIFDTIEFLKKIGAKISYDEYTITISRRENDDIFVQHTIISDPIEAITYIIYSGINLHNDSISTYTIGPINIPSLGDAYNSLKNIGIELIESNSPEHYYVKKYVLKSFYIETGFFPNIYTDVQPFFCLLALFSDGNSTIKENIYNDRFRYIEEIKKIGYQIELLNNCMYVKKTDIILDKNMGQEFICHDLRGGMAIFLLLKMHGIETSIINIDLIDRGYCYYQENIYKILTNSPNKFIENYDTKLLSNINIGGSCKYFYEASSLHKIVEIVQYCNNNLIPYKVIGGGNNIYFSEMYDGMIIFNNYKEMYITDNNIFYVSSGTQLIDFVLFASLYGYDISELFGIPSTIGGAVYGNAGAYELEISDIIHECVIICDGKIVTVKNDDIHFGYRDSIFKKKMSKVILGCYFNIKKINNTNKILEKCCNFISLRNKKIKTEKTLGSVFKNVIIDKEKYYAWKMIDALDIRGKIINNIMISAINPNIFYNYNNATPDDLKKLINYIIENVHNIKMNLEIEII